MRRFPIDNPDEHPPNHLPILPTSELRIPRILPGRIRFRRGCFDDYKALASFHYIPRKPTFVIATAIAEHVYRRRTSLVGAAVLTWPIPNVGARARYFGGFDTRRGELDFVNKNVRTISRVIVHPLYRSLGLSTGLIHCICNICPTRYVESIARMGGIHPLFERAGMTRIDPVDPAGVVDSSRATYFILDRFPTPASGKENSHEL